MMSSSATLTTRAIGLAAAVLALAGAGCPRPPATSPAPIAAPIAAPSPAAAAAARAPQPNPASITARAPDAFYDPPADLPHRPGALLRSGPLTDVTLPPGMRGWRILYTTAVDDRTPATAVATVFAPEHPPAGPRPVLVWEHGTTGALQRCMPSLLSAPAEGIPAPERIVEAGWVVVATDYSFAEKGGPHPYLIGEGEARSALDSVRAARRMPELALGTRAVVWGYSQGGHAALWTGIVGPRYAPDVTIAGVAAIAPAADLRAIIAMNPAVDKRLGSYLAAAYGRFYPDLTLEQALRPEARDAGREIAGLCGFLPPEDPERIGQLLATFEGPALATATNKALVARLEENAASGAIAAPVVIAQGRADTTVPAAATDAYVDARCAAGQRLEYWTFAGRNHGTIAAPGSPLEAPLVSWTAARFADEPQAGGCERRSF
jgi:alpha-beta hydrolase superfamily lysophospholipase